MHNEDFGKSRRRFLTTAATVVGGIGVAATATPFISTWMPSAKTKAIGGPVEVDISGMQPGEIKIEKWQGKPVWILRRSQKTLDELSSLGSEMRDPDSSVEQQPAYAENEYRSVKPEFLIVVGLCTHLGCSPKYLSPKDKHDLG
ncbi:MAG: ubiquinol-cytochrome c reductase iron-sulfur subunit, partial [Gammaproteobacteria bacterium]